MKLASTLRVACVKLVYSLYGVRYFGEQNALADVAPRQSSAQVSFAGRVVASAGR